MGKKTLWETYTPEMKAEMTAFCEDYKKHLSECKTERECVSDMIARAEQYGYQDLDKLVAAGTALKAGDKVYASNRGKMLVLVQVGTTPITEGVNILGAHIDSPRLDLKPNPLYEEAGLAMLKTHYYGGIKKYQWVALPLALHGVVAKKDGSVVNIVIGEEPGDPVLGISDILPHLGKDQAAKKLGEAFTGEDLNVCIGSIPTAEDEDEKASVKATVLAMLKEKYDIEEEDFLSAELEIVPAGPARDYGLDRSMVMGYGHDDRICGYTSFMAMMDCPEASKTLVTVLTDKEEVGSIGATGMHSRFFENVIAEVMELVGDYSDLKLRRAMAASKMLSSDVSAAFDPNFPGVSEKNNCPFFGFGPAFFKYTGSRGKSGSNDATAEYIAELRKLYEEEEIAFQMGELGKVDQGGGGTIAYIPAQLSMDVIDMGIPLHNMHAPYEIASKVDIYEAYRAYKAFLTNL